MDIDEFVRADVERYGWHVAKIAADDDVPAWAHTIGLTERFSHPELVVFGLDLDPMHQLLNAMGGRIRDGECFEADTAYPGILAQHAVVLRAIQPRWFGAFLGNAAWYYGERPFAALQCFWPGPNGRHPWEPAFDPEWEGRQPLLYLDEVEGALSPALAFALRSEGAI